MKLNKLFLFMLVSILALNSCSSDDDDVVNNLEKEYFTIENANFVDADLNGGTTTNLLSSVNVNKNVINGGTSIVSFSSAKELKSVQLGVKGEKGYYEYPLTSTKSSENVTVYHYDVLIIITQDIAVKDFVITLCVTDIEGNRSTLHSTETIKVVEAGTGELQASLSWDLKDDVDLHLYDPKGNHIYYYNRIAYTEDYNEALYNFELARYLVKEKTDHNVDNLKFDNDDDIKLLNTYLKDAVYTTKDLNEFFAKHGGKYGIAGNLDIDSNPSCNYDGINNENIYYNSLTNGVYAVYVNLWRKCENSGTQGSKYSVSLNFKGNYIKLSDKMRGQFEGTNSGNSSDIVSRMVQIGTFTIRDGNITVGGEYVGNKAKSTDRTNLLEETIKNTLYSK